MRCVYRHLVPFFRPFKPSVMQEHADCLLRLCRVCAGYMNLTRSMSPIYCCANYASDLMIVLGINLAKLIPLPVTLYRFVTCANKLLLRTKMH